jgi:two-component system response regulator MprA
VRLRITKELRGEIDGIDLSRYREGLTYTVGSTLANYLLAQGWAVPEPDDTPPSPAPHRVVQAPSILIVEDDQDMRLILSQLLEYHGWSSHAAADGLEGLEALARVHPSLILLDLAMPKMDGMAFRAAQRELPDRRLATVPVVIVSAVHDAPKYQSLLRAADVLVKPFEAGRLLESVEHHMRPASLFRW